MVREHSARERRIAAVSLLIVVLAALGWLMDASFFGPRAEMRALRADLREQQQRDAALVAQQPLIQTQLDETQRDASASASLMPGSDPGAVAADLMQKVGEMIERNADVGAGCALKQRMPIVPEQATDSAFTQVKLSLDLECATEPLERVLYELEYGRPLLFVEEIDLRRASDSDHSSGAGRLVVHLLVSGYMQRGAEPAAELSP